MACGVTQSIYLLLIAPAQFLDGKEDWKLTGTWKKTLSREIKRLSEAGKLVPGKTAVRYKLSEETKKKAAPKVGAPAASCLHAVCLHRPSRWHVAQSDD